MPRHWRRSARRAGRPRRRRAAPAAGAAPSTGFAVQLGAFRSEGDAAALVNQLRGAGFTVFSERVQTANGTLHRVRVGPELDRAAAERLKSRLPAPHSANGMIVSHP
ncbi:SPOR domain-containing protein [Alkalisalibacterium limincola]|nr:SPOR domain-containing protein [Alkalisalibacterium limincola]